MDDFERNLTVAASADAAYAALTTIGGLRAWWTEDCEGEAGAGGAFTVHFGEVEKTMRVAVAEPGREVRWDCTHAYLALPAPARTDEWVGTTVVWRLSPLDAGRVRIELAHLGLRPALACYDLCVHGWDDFLGSLRALLETGAGAPFRRHPEETSV